jgi:hypothetical protein
MAILTRPPDQSKRFGSMSAPLRIGVSVPRELGFPNG